MASDLDKFARPILPREIPESSGFANNNHEPRKAPPFAERLEQEQIGSERGVPGERKKEAPLSESLALGLRSTAELSVMEVPERERLLGEFFCEADLGFLYAPRGVGKTFFAFSMAISITKGRDMGPWKAGQLSSVIYVDGEMPADLMKKRTISMEAEAPNLLVLNHEILFQKTGLILNIARPEVQNALTDLCLARGARVLVLDNLSSLASGVKENEGDSWEQILGWLLHLRRLKIAVLIVHHSGRNGEMRGTSRREDAAFWIIRLEQKESGGVKDGARFVSVFTKQRNSPLDPPCLEWSYSPDKGTGQMLTGCKEASPEDLVLQLVAEDVTKASEIAEAMHMRTYQISRIAKRLENKGLLRKKGRGYELVDESS
jgi:hypothetical protein